jgi:hypothetical protein
LIEQPPSAVFPTFRVKISYFPVQPHQKISCQPSAISYQLSAFLILLIAKKIFHRPATLPGQTPETPGGIDRCQRVQQNYLLRFPVLCYGELKRLI